MAIKRIRVAIVYHYVAHYRKAIFQKLSQDKHIEYTIISGCRTDIDIKLVDPKYATLPLEKGGIRWKFVRNKWFFNRVLFQIGLHRELAKKKYDTVIFMGNAYFLSTWIEALICRLKGVSVMMWGHGLLRYEGGLKGIIRKSFYKLAHAHLIYSLRSIKIMRKSGFKNANLYQINNSLDYDTHVQLRKRLLNSSSPFQNNGPLKIIFIGRLTKQKKLALLLRAQTDLIRRGRKIDVTFIGDGVEKRKLENLAERLGIAKNVTFIGPCYDERTVGSFLYHADICVSPGEIGLTAIHALTFGTPVITHDDFDFQMPEVESIKDGLTGAFFKKDSAKSLAYSIDRFVSTQPNRKRTREICYKSIDKFFTPEYQCDVFNNAVIENNINA